MLRFTLSTFFLLYPLLSIAQHDTSEPFDWRPDIEIDTLTGDSLLADFDWSDWEGEDWDKAFKEEYKHYYSEEGADDILNQTYQYANEQNITMPQRQGQITYDPEKEEIHLESESDYYDRINDWTEKLNDDLTQAGLDAALNVLYTELEPVLRALKKKNSALLDKILPQGSGVPVLDPAEKLAKKKLEGKKNFKYWVKLAAENVMQSLFKKNAEGKYELQREKIELLKQVGIIRFLKMSVMDWEIMQSLALEVPDEMLSYAHTLQEIYQSGEATFKAGKELYRQIHTLDTELNIPAQYGQFQDLSLETTLNRLTLAEMVNRRKKMLALTYRELAERYSQYGEDLNRQLKTDDKLKMNDAERIKTAEIANAYFGESLQLQAKAERLLSSSHTSITTFMKVSYANQRTAFGRFNNYLIR